MAKTKNIIRSKYKQSYTNIDNAALKDGRLSFKARGLLSYMLSLPEDWEVYITYLADQSPDGRRAITSGMTELEGLGYLQNKGLRKGSRGFAGYEYRVFESPKDNHTFEKGRQVQNVQHSENRQVQNVQHKGLQNVQHKGLQNVQLVSTDIITTEYKELLRNSIGTSTSEVPTTIIQSEVSTESTQPEKKEEVTASVPQSSALSEPLLPGTGKLGIDSVALDLVHELYKLFGTNTSRLPTSPADTSHATANQIMECFSSLRAGTFLETHKIDDKWLEENKIPEELSKRSFSTWGSFHREVIKSAERYLAGQKTKPCSVLRFFSASRGAGGAKVPTYSQFLKYCSDSPITDAKAQISKIQGKVEENLRESAEKFYNNMLAKFSQTFQDYDNLRFWIGIEKLIKWHADNIEKIDLQNPDGNYKTHVGNTYQFFTTLFKWLDDEGGAWGSLYPDIIKINGKQWDQFVTWCKVNHKVELKIQEIDQVEYLEKLYALEKARRYQHRESSIVEKVEKLADELSDKEGTSWREAEVEAQEKVKGEYLTKDMEWEEAWEVKLMKAKAIK